MRPRELARDKLDPRAEAEGQSPDARKSTAIDSEGPPTMIDSKVGTEDHAPGEQTVGRDVERAT